MVSERQGVVRGRRAEGRGWQQEGVLVHDEREERKEVQWHQGRKGGTGVGEEKME